MYIYVIKIKENIYVKKYINKTLTVEFIKLTTI